MNNDSSLDPKKPDFPMASQIKKAKSQVDSWAIRKEDYSEIEEVLEQNNLQSARRLKEDNPLNNAGLRRLSLTGINCELDPSFHWLKLNRLSWFGQRVPPTDAIRIGESVSQDEDEPTRPRPSNSPTQAFDALRDEFCSPLSTVIGGLSYNPLPGKIFCRHISWQGLQDGTSMNGLHGLEVFARTIKPDSIPVVKSLLVTAGDDDVEEHKVLVHGVEEGYQLREGMPRSPLTFDFAAPQRAVAIEFGYITDEVVDGSDTSKALRITDVLLVAKDSEGTKLITSSAEEISTNRLQGYPGQLNRLQPDRPLYVIGVRHEKGEISTVELQLLLERDAAKVLIVARIWHEALPPAAVTQGVLVAEGGRGSFAEFTGALGQLEEPVDMRGEPIPFRSERTHLIPLPFRLNRAVVMLRGFKLQTLDQTPREISRISVEVNPFQFGQQRVSQTPGVFSIDRGGSVSLEPTGELKSPERGSWGFRIYVYYTLVAWDSDQVDLEVAQATLVSPPIEQDKDVVSPLLLADPCRISSQTTGCGPLFGALQGFKYHMRQGQEIETFILSVGQSDLFQVGQTDVSGDSGISDGLAIPTLVRDGVLKWEIMTSLAGGDEYSREVRGTVLAGSSVQLRSPFSGPGVFLSPPRVGLRQTPNSFLDGWSSILTSISGDLAFLGLGSFRFDPDGPVRELEVELYAENYNGQVLQWSLGAGISTAPWIAGGAFASDGLESRVFGFPTIASLSRKAILPRVGIEVRMIEFIGYPETISITPRQFGVIRNTGSLPVVVALDAIGGTEPLSFNFVLFLKGDVLPIETEVAIFPQQSLFIGGAFSPSSLYTPDDANMYSAELAFRTSISNLSLIGINASARLLQIDASGEVIPSVVAFVVTPQNAGRTLTRNVFITSTGRSPLVIAAIELESESGNELGSSSSVFRWTVLSASPREFVSSGAIGTIAPGSSLGIQILLPSPLPPQPLTGGIEDRLIVKSNAGDLYLRLIVFYQ